MKAQTCPFGMIMTSCLGKMLDKAKNQGKPRRYLRNINVRWFGFDLSDVQEMRIADDEVERYSIKKGDLVVCEGGEPGRCAIWCDGETVCFQKALHRVRFNAASDPRFYMYYLWMLARSGMLSAYYTGTGIKHLTGESLKKLPVPVPPLSEQKRIVARIEELFSELDSGVETLKMIKSKVDRYKYSVIDSVLPSENQKSIADCIKEMGQGWSPKCERVNVVDDDNWAVIKTTAVQPCKFLFDENKALPSSLAPRERHEIMAGDILITRAGPKSRCGVCCMVRKTKRRLLNCDKVYRLRLHEDIVLPQYLEYVLNSPAFIQEINLCKTGGNDSGLNLTQDRFLSIRIPVPSIKKQEEIVSEIESRRSVCDSIEKTVNAALRQAEAMRQSILKKAFEGKL